MARRSRLRAFTRWMSWPATSTRPALGVFEPVMSSKRVVLPEPFGPITPTISGFSTAKLASSRKVVFQRRRYSLTSPSTLRIVICR